MREPIHILIVEDNEDDALLLLNELRYGGLSIGKHLRVQTEAALRDALSTHTWHVVISDYTMPGFDGLKALAVVREKSDDIPFILISGMIGEETAVAALKAGANDYLLKDRLSRLSKAIQNELDDADQRRRLKEAQEQLAVANAIAVLANKRKSQVLAFVAHEFKNPLQAITLFSDLLHDEVYGALNERQQSSVANIQMATQHLKTLVSDILDIAAIEAGKIKLNVGPYNMADLLDHVLRLTRELARQQNIVIQYKSNVDQLMLTGDERRLKQIFINLVSNAIKYSASGTEVTLQLLDDQQHCRIDVIDQGIGISPEDLEQLFQEFYRVDNRKSAHVEGVGLGLALCKTLVDMHGGRIEVDSVLGQGSVFSVVLPKHYFSADVASPLSR